MTDECASASGAASTCVDLYIPEAMNYAVQSIVTNKYLIDCAVGDSGARMLAGDLHDGSYGPHEPLPFLSRILPFSHTCKRTDNGTPDFLNASVPTANTLGCSWRWRGKSLSPAERQKCLSRTTDFQSMVDRHGDIACYGWVKPLGIFLPSEGKNRVDFLREEGVATIPAKVFEMTYADPGRLAIYRIKLFGFETTWAVLDGRWVEQVSHPTWTIPLMRAYGVEISDKWPDAFPHPDQVQHAFFQRPGVTSPLGNPDAVDASMVDLDTLASINDFESARIKSTLLHLKDTQINHRLLAASFLVAIASLILVGTLPETLLDLRLVFAGVGGAAVIISIAPFTLPLVIARRRALTNCRPFARPDAPKSASVKSSLHLG